MSAITAPYDPRQYYPAFGRYNAACFFMAVGVSGTLVSEGYKVTPVYDLMGRPPAKWVNQYYTWRIQGKKGSNGLSLYVDIPRSEQWCGRATQDFPPVMVDGRAMTWDEAVKEVARA